MIQMNAVEYVIREATSFGYCGKMEWRDGKMVSLPDNFPFMRGKCLTEAQHERMQDGKFLIREVKKCAKQLNETLEKQGRDYFKDWSIPMSLYTCEIEYSVVTCKIVFTHRKTKADLCLVDVYFDSEGTVLQAVPTF